MVEIEFIYLENKTIIQGNLDDSFSFIINKFIDKSKLDLNNLHFLSNGKILNKNDLIKNIMNESEIKNKKKIILVQSINNTINIGNNNFIKSNDIICPTCKEICKYEIKDYRIKLLGCKNGHIKENIKLKEFNDTQKIDITKIKCNICNKSKNEVFNQELYICCDCNKNLCLLCKSKHDNTHSIINYENKNYVCIKHDEQFFKYCEDCKIDLCLSCTEGHKNHKVISFEDKLINLKDLRKKMNDLNSLLNTFKKNLNELIQKLKNIEENMDIFYNILNDTISISEKNKNRNYNLLVNLNNINDILNHEINKIKNNSNYAYNLSELLNLYEEMNGDKEQNVIINKANNNEKAKLFCFPFIAKDNFRFINKAQLQKCKIVYEDEEYNSNENKNNNFIDKIILKIQREKTKLITINFIVTSGYKCSIQFSPNMTNTELFSYFLESINCKINLYESSKYVLFLYNGYILNDFRSYDYQRIEGIQIQDGGNIIVIDFDNYIKNISEFKYDDSELEFNKEIELVISEIKKNNALDKSLNDVIKEIMNPRPKMCINFVNTYGHRHTIYVNFETSIDQLLKIYLKRINKGNSNAPTHTYFLCNAIQLKLGDNTSIGNFFRNSINPKILVNEIVNSDLSYFPDSQTIHSHFEELFKKYKLFLGK